MRTREIDVFQKLTQRPVLLTTLYDTHCCPERQTLPKQNTPTAGRGAQMGLAYGLADCSPRSGSLFDLGLAPFNLRGALRAQLFIQVAHLS